MPPVEWPMTVTRVIPSEASSARVFPASSWKVYWWCAGFVDLQNPIWSGAMTRKPASARTVMVSSQVAAQKFLPCRSTTARPFGAGGCSSMYAISTASPCKVKEKCATGRGYSNPSSRGPYAGSSSAAGVGPAAADATPRQSTDRRSTEQRITHLPMIEFPRPNSENVGVRGAPGFVPAPSGRKNSE